MERIRKDAPRRTTLTPPQQRPLSLNTGRKEIEMYAIAKDGKILSSFTTKRYRTGSVSGLDLTNNLDIDGDVVGQATFPQGWGAFVQATIEPGHARDVRCRGYHKCVYITLELQEGWYIIPPVFGAASVGYYGVLQDSVGAFVKGYGKKFSVAALPDVAENTGEYVAHIILDLIVKRPLSLCNRENGKDNDEQESKSKAGEIYSRCNRNQFY